MIVVEYSSNNSSNDKSRVENDNVRENNIKITSKNREMKWNSWLIGKQTEMTQELIDQKYLNIPAKISTTKTFAIEYEKHYYYLTIIGEQKQKTQMPDRKLNKCHGNYISIWDISETRRGERKADKSIG